MGWEKTEKRYKDFSHGEKVRFLGVEGAVYKPGWFEMEREDIYVAVILSGSNQVQRLHFETLEVEVPEPKPEPKVQYRETNYYLDTQTGTLYYDKGFDAIPVNVIKESMASSILAAHPARYKRLIREV